MAGAESKLLSLRSDGLFVQARRYATVKQLLKFNLHLLIRGDSMEKVSHIKTKFVLILILLTACPVLAQFPNLPSEPVPAIQYDPCGSRRSSLTVEFEYEPRRPFEIPLLEAVYTGNIDEVKKLIAGGADANAQTERGETPLLLASSNPNLEIAKLLLTAGADPNLASASDVTPLMNASSGKCIALTKLLLDKGAKLDVNAYTGRTALMNAAENGNTDAAKLLVAAGADIYVSDLDRWPPLLLAIKARDFGLVRYLFACDKKKKFDASLDAALIEAIKSGNTEIVRLMLDKGADINQVSVENPGRPLGYAVQTDIIETVLLLLARGADPNAMKQGGRAIMTSAAIHGNSDIVRVLIDAKADVNPKKQDWSPLTEATRGNHIEVMKLLIKAGADLNARAYDGWTPLMMAVSNGMHRPQAVKLLIESGADVNMKDDDDEKITALAIARGCRWDDIVIILLEAGAIE